jgi:anti-sigma28 factor (negative regulator of flagellin synthesis)
MASTLNELEKAVEMIKKAVAEGELDENLNAVADVISRRIHKRTK